jgi:hypothetical protein
MAAQPVKLTGAGLGKTFQVISIHGKGLGLAVK